VNIWHVGWNLQPRWLKRISLFLRIVGRRGWGGRLGVSLAWEVAGIVHPREETR
jgi:hypothetical protein